MNNHPKQGDGRTNQTVTLCVSYSSILIVAKRQIRSKLELHDDDEVGGGGDYSGDLVPWCPHIEHDVANEVVVEGKRCLFI